MKLQIAADLKPLEEACSQIEGSLLALEQVPQFPLEEFLGLLHGLIANISVEPLGSAASAGNDRIVLRVGGLLELFASAVGALERQLCHRDSPLLG